jgi:adenylate kinase
VIIVLIGPPGSGKGTQASILSKKISLPIISTGEIFRKTVEEGKEDGKRLSEYMSQGKLVPSSFVSALVKTVLSQTKYVEGCILDGYPRTIDQAEFLDSIINQDIKAIYFDVSDDVIVNRILGRYSCANCGAIYNKFYAKPKVENFCDVCHSENFVHRSDDNESAIISRLRVYREETYPVISFYQSTDRCYTIDAGKPSVEVTKELEDLFIRFQEEVI